MRVRNLWRGKGRKDIPRHVESSPRGARVLVHAGDQFIGVGEFQLRADPADERDVDFAPIEVAGKIEQEHFQQHGAVIERRTTAKACNPTITRVPNADAHRINAVSQL
jgi:hypothetical protein